MDTWCLILNICKTVSSIFNGCVKWVKFLCLGSKIIQKYLLIVNALGLLELYPNLLNADSKYGVSCSIYILIYIVLL
jgi:hypothetical protein